MARVSLALAALLSPLVLPAAASARDAMPVAEQPQDGPVAVIEAFYRGLTEVMRDGPALGPEGRYRKLEPLVSRTFNLATMTQVAVGPRWNTLSTDQQARLIEAFRRFTVASYASNFDNFEGERFEVGRDLQPTPAGNMVLSRLVIAGRKPIDLNYVMRQAGDGWRAIDVYAEGTISELARRRSEFGAVLARNGADALADRLVEKAQTLLNQPA